MRFAPPNPLRIAIVGWVEPLRNPSSCCAHGEMMGIAALNPSYELAVASPQQKFRASAQRPFDQISSVHVFRQMVDGRLHDPSSCRAHGEMMGIAALHPSL